MTTSLVADRFRIDGSLGRGGMGEVYRAWDKKLARPVALKWVRADQREDASVTGRFLREARAAAALRHPNIVTIYDLGEDAGSMYIVMELVEGRSLRTAIGDASVSLPLRVTWLEEMASALAAAHAAGLVHRDVKPGNVMVAGDGHVKVLDFGLAKRAEGMPALGKETGMVPSFRTEHGMVLGTPTYMAPEQARGEVVDARVDQYAWGLVGYEVMLGRRWDPSLRDAPAPPSRIVADVLPILRRATEPDRHARFGSMMEVASLVGRVRSAVGAPAPTTTLGAVPSMPAPMPTLTQAAAPAPMAAPMPPAPAPAPAGAPAPAPAQRPVALVALGALGALAIIGLTLAAVVLLRPASPKPADKVVDAGPSLAAVPDAAPPPAASVAPSAVPKATAARATASASAKPAAAARLKFGGTLARGFRSGATYGECPGCDGNAWFEALDGAYAPLAACYEKTIYTPPFHRMVQYEVDVSAAGAFGTTRIVHPLPPNTALAECVGKAIRTVPLKKNGGGPGKLWFQFSDECRPPLLPDGHRDFEHCE